MIQDGVDLNLKLAVAFRESLRQFSERLYKTDDIREEPIRAQVEEAYTAATKLRDYLEAKATQQLAHKIDWGSD